MSNIVKTENASVVRDPVRMMPSFDVRETKESFIVKADLPGVKKDDIKVDLAGNQLSISGSREEETESKEDTFYAYERSWGSFSRVFTLPDGVDVKAMKTDLADGVLSLVIPKVKKS